MDLEEFGFFKLQSYRQPWLMLESAEISLNCGFSCIYFADLGQAGEAGPRGEFLHNIDNRDFLFLIN